MAVEKDKKKRKRPNKNLSQDECVGEKSNGGVTTQGILTTCVKTRNNPATVDQEWKTEK